MKWSYKTVHFELKKEGLLGSGFLDESEIEQELNEFGLVGWELVSVLEVQDGVIAFFKQPIYLEGSAGARPFAEDGSEEDGDDVQLEEYSSEVCEEYSAEDSGEDSKETARNHDDGEISDNGSVIGAIKIE